MVFAMRMICNYQMIELHFLTRNIGPTQVTPTAQRLTVNIYRLLLAFPAGLALANLLAAALAILLHHIGMEQSEAMTLSLLVAYLAMPAWMLWIYCTANLAWLGAKGLLFGLVCAIVIYFPW